MISSRGRVWSRTGVGDRRRRASGSPSKMTSHRTRKPAVSREFLHEDRGSSRRRLAEDSRKTGPNAIRDDHYLGLAKTHLQHVLTAGAMNLARLAAWFAG